MTSSEQQDRKSSLREVSVDEPKGVLKVLLKAAKKEERLVLSDAHKALKRIKRAKKMIGLCQTDIFGESYGVKRIKRFRRLIDDAMQLTVRAKVHLPLIEKIAEEVKDWLESHKKKDAEILPADEKIIQEVRSTATLLDRAVENLKELEALDWGSISAGQFAFGMYYIPIKRQKEKMTEIRFRSDWMQYLERTIDSLERFETAVERIFELQKQINVKYRA